MNHSTNEQIIWTGDLDGVDMLAMRLASAYTVVCQAESRQQPLLCSFLHVL